MIDPIENNESGLSARQKLNKLIDVNYHNSRVENLMNMVTWNETSGSGSTSNPSNTESNHEIDTGLTSGSYAIKRFGFRTGHNIDSDNRQTNFGKKYQAHIAFESINRTSDGAFRFYIGKVFNAGVGDASARAFGFALKNETLFLHSHNNSALQEESTGITITTADTKLVQLYFSPGESLEMYFNGNKVAEITSGLPSSVQGVSIRGFFEVENGGDSDRTRARIYHYTLITEY